MKWTPFTSQHAANILDLVPEAYVCLDNEFRYAFVNRAAEQLLGKDRADLLGNALWEVYPALVGTPFEEHYRRAMAERIQITFEDYYAPWQRWFAVTATPDPDDGILIRLADISERKRAEEALRESEERYRTILQAAREGFVLVDRHGSLREVNDAYCRMSGYSVQELLAMRIQDLEASETASETAAHIQKLMVQGEDRFESRHRRKDGSVFDVEVSTRYGSDGGWFVSFLRDITERKRAEEALRESEEKKREILDSIADAFFSLDDDMVVRYFNPAAERMLNRKADEVMGRRLFDAFPEALGSVFEKNYAHCIRTKTALSFEVDFTTAPYQNWYDVRVYPERRGIAVFFQVITERKRAEEEREKLQAQLAQAQKMESIGRLAGGVAHDFNNLLTVINGYSDLELRRTRPGDPQFESLTEIARAGERAAGLVRQLLAFSRKQVLQPEVLDLNVTVSAMENMLPRLVGEHIEVVVRLDPSVAPIVADRNQIEQVIMNLAVNAGDAMPDGGTMTLETGQRHLEGVCRTCGAEMHPGEYVELTVCDTGMGMDEHTLEHLFEPFFTTKDLGKGTGLGLSTVQGIVLQSGGHIGVESEPGKGSAFHIYLPVAERPAVEPSLLTGAEAGGGAETILVVEDEEAVRRFIVAILKGYGYRVVETGDAEQALRECASQPVDLLLTDVVMPKMSGGELARRARLTLPGLRTLFISGYSEEMRERTWESPAGAKFLQKPFAPEALAAKVREVLEGR
jgi:two-component system, cell cycle sensor histidine kinase and response regulator CckA